MKVISSTNTILAFMVYCVMSSVFILWSSHMSVSINDMKSKTKKIDALYALYYLSIFFIAFSPLSLFDNNHLAHPITFKLIFVTGWLLFFILSIVLLNSNKRRDNAAKICFAIVLINMFVSVGHLYVVLESSQYKFLRCPIDYKIDTMEKLFPKKPSYKTADHPLSCMHELLSPDFSSHDFNDDSNRQKFLGSCAFNLLDDHSYNLLSKMKADRYDSNEEKNNNIYLTNDNTVYLREDELTPYYNEIDAGLYGINDKGELITVMEDDQFDKTVCEKFYELMKEKQRKHRSQLVQDQEEINLNIATDAVDLAPPVYESSAVDLAPHVYESSAVDLAPPVDESSAVNLETPVDEESSATGPAVGPAVGPKKSKKKGYGYKSKSLGHNAKMQIIREQKQS